MTTILFTSANPSLAKIAIYNSAKDWVNLKLSNVKAVDREAFTSMLAEMSPTFWQTVEDINELQVASIKYKEGQFQRCYPVSLYTNADNKFVIKLGQKVALLENLLDAEITLFNIEKYEDPCLVITQETENGDINMLPLPLRLNEEGYTAAKENDVIFVKKLNIALKKGNIEAIAKYLLVATEGGATNNTELVDIRSLPDMTPIQVNAVKPVETKFGHSFVLKIVRPSDEVEVEMWCPSNLKKIFQLGGKITPGKSMLTYSEYTNKSGKSLIDAKITNIIVEQDEDDVDLAGLY